MWGFLRDAEVSSECINRGLMLPMSRESWVLKEACTIGNCTLNDSAVAAQVLASHEPCQAFSRPQSRQSSRPRTGSRPSSVGGCRKPKRPAASLAELKESASNRAASWLRNYATYEQNAQMLQVALTLGDGQHSSLQRTNSAPEPLRPSSATNRGPDRRGKVSGGAAMTLQRRQGGHLRRPGPGLRCETSERLLRKENGWPAPWADGSVAHDLVRPATTPSRTREKKIDVKGTTTGVVRAVECDKKFQAQLLETWKRSNDLDEASERVHRRQVCQFFDFLKRPDGDMDMESAVLPYINEGFASPEYVEAEIARAAPDIHGKDMPQAGGELSALKQTAIRQVLVLYSQVARPQNIGTQEVIFRSAFCRFILDSNLVAIEAEDTERPTYHKSVRLFDNISKFSGGLARYANIDHCVTLVVQLMMQINMPAALAWELFEEGLQKAERTAEALLRETQSKARQTAEALAVETTEEAILERRMEIFGKHGSPPQLFQGPLATWTRGLRFWINSVTTSCEPEATMERMDQVLAYEQYLRDEILEPGCLCVVSKFQGLFEELFSAYCYEEKTATKEDENGKIRLEPVQHMSFAAFFRFCLDFSIFPSLISFEEAWQAYSKADCVQLLGSKESPLKVKRFKKVEANPSRVSAILGLRNMVNRNRKGWERETSIDYDKKSETSRSEQEEEEELTSESESSDEEEEVPDEVEPPTAPSALLDAGGESGGSALPSTQSSRHPSVGAQEGNAEHLAPVVRKTEKKSTLTLQQERHRRVVNDSEVAAAIRNHRRLSVGPGDHEAQQAQLQQVVQQINHLSEAKDPPKVKEVTIQPEPEVAKLPEPPRPEKRSSAGPPNLHTPPSLVRGASPRGVSPAASPRVVAPAPVVPVPHEKQRKVSQEVEPGHRRGSAGNRFLSVLGALDPTKVKDLMMDSPVEQPKKVAPRVKYTADFSWLQKPFREMTDKELKGYSLLIVVDECCKDHFLNVRGLVANGKIQRSRQGLLSYIAFMELLKKFRITHTFETSSELQEFMRTIDPCSDGMLDPVELEKAIAAVREDEARRRPNAAPRGGPFAASLGEEARRLSGLPAEVDASGKEVPVAFNVAAFAESLLLLGHHHMHGSGALIKCCAPSPAKAMYLINFLHYQHDRLVKTHIQQREEAITVGAEQAATVLVRPRSPPLASEKEGEKSNALTRMIGAARKVQQGMRDIRAGQHRNAVLAVLEPPDVVVSPVESHGSRTGATESKSEDAGPSRPPSPSSRKTPSPRGLHQEHWPDGASYVTVSQQLLKDKQEIFKRWMDGEGKLPQLSPWFSESNQTCSKCKRKRDSHGIGNVFCHVCSCVDSKPLNETILFPVMERARLRRKMGSQVARPPEKPAPTRANLRAPDASSQRSGSNHSN